MKRKIGGTERQRDNKGALERKRERNRKREKQKEIEF